VELDVSVVVERFASKNTRMWVGQEECFKVEVIARSVRCLSMPPNAGGPHPVRV